MKRLAKSHTDAEGAVLRALKQAARELLLAQASDWAFMINSGTTGEYASQRTKTHISRLNRLVNDVDAGEIDKDWLSTIESQDNVFPQIECRWFC
jgi:1,4-alpha-glucan branching enzyme